jgi:hypothetical protein
MDNSPIKRVTLVGVDGQPTSNASDVDLGSLIAGEDLTNDVLKVEDRSTYTNISASALIKTGAGRVKGFMVNSHSSGTLKLWDNTSAATTVLLNTITFAAGSGLMFNLPDVEFGTGLYATIGGTADITIFWK